MRDESTQHEINRSNRHDFMDSIVTDPFGDWSFLLHSETPPPRMVECIGPGTRIERN